MRRSIFALVFGLAIIVARASDARAGGIPCGSGGAVADDGGDAGGEDAGDDAGLCPANAYCAFSDGGEILDGASGTCEVLACGGTSGACPINVYCAYPDAGIILDGAAGSCALEPCVLSSDCTNPNTPICDTSQNPYECIGCISGSDCTGDLVCDTATHTCVNPPPVPDASALEDAGVDGAADASPLADATAPLDAAPPTEGGSATGSGDASTAGEDGSVGPALPDQGSLDGGAWDCGLAPDGRWPVGALAGAAAFGALLVARRRGRGKRRG